MLDLISPLVRDEFHFLEQISDVLRRVVSGEALSDSQKHIFSTEHPFELTEMNLMSERSAQSMCELTVCELTDEHRLDSEV